MQGSWKQKLKNNNAAQSEKHKAPKQSMNHSSCLTNIYLQM